jgi:RNA polymerase sigma-70 factor (ECF subfamily)
MNSLQKNSKIGKKTDEEIIALVQGGEQEFFDLVIDRYREKLFFYVKSFVKNEEETKDVLQNIFIKALKNISSFDCGRKFSSWIYRIAHNEAINWVTRKKDTISIEDLNEFEGNFLASNDFDVLVEKWFHLELKDLMKEAIDKLPENYAEVIKMYYFEEKSYKEISEILKKPINSIGTLISRAKKSLLEIVLKSKKL